MTRYSPRGTRQQLVIRYLLKRLRECKHELNTYHGVFLNFSDVVQAQIESLRKLYRESDEIRQITEKEFSPFDELVEGLDEESQDQALLKMLEKYNPTGDPN